MVLPSISFKNPVVHLDKNTIRFFNNYTEASVYTCLLYTSDKAAARKKEGTRILMDMGPFVHSAFESRRGFSEAFDRFGTVILT